MARKPRSTAKPEASNLLQAVKFVSSILKETGSPSETHLSLANNWATSFNSIIAIGHPVTEDLTAVPNARLLEQALSKCGQNISITQLDNQRLSIKSEKFKATVPCLSPDVYQIGVPDQNIAPINDEFKKALEVTGILASENAQTVICASILMNGASLISTNRHVIFEYWHGCNLPTNIPLPKALVTPLTKTQKKLVGFGLSNNSVTFHFEDGCWIKSQVYSEAWPDLGRLLNGPANPFPVPKDFFNAVDAVGPFSPDGWLHFDAGLLRSEPGDNSSAAHDVPGLPKGPVYPAKQLILIKELAEQIDFVAQGPYPGTNVLKFFGKSIRGMIAGRN